MEINNVFSPVPFYANKRYWHSNKWYTYGQKCPIIMTAEKTLPFQLVVSTGVTLSSFTIKKADNDASVMTVNTAGNYFNIDAETYSIIQVKACTIGALPYGNYYYALTLSDGSTYISDIIAIISDMSKCIKITYKNVENLYFSSGHIDFTNDFVFELYLPTTIGKPEYEYEEELTKRLGYKFVESQIVNKVYKFTFPATEQLCDAYRFVRMCDYIRIDTYNPDFSDYDHYNVIYLSSEVEWLDNGDIASVETSFETDSIVQKLQDYSRTQLVNFYNALLSNSDEALKFDDETIAQYYSNYIQSIDGKMIRQLNAVSSISDNTVIAIDENNGTGAANKILLKPLLINTVAEQLQASEVLANFQQHINNSAIHITAAERALLSLFGVDDNGDVYVKGDKGFYTNSFVSAKGKSSSTGGGASALYQLVDVLANENNDGVQGATTNSVLMYNGTKWYAGTVNAGLDEAALKAYLDANKYTTTVYVDSQVSTINNQITTINGQISAINSQLDTKVDKTDLDKKVDNAFFARVFGLLDANGNEIAVNDVATVADSIKAKFGLWTEQYISAKGKNSSGGSTGSASALYQLVDVLANENNDGVQGATTNSVLMYNGTKWYAGTVNTGLDEAALKSYLDANKYTTASYVDSQLDTKADKTALSAYLPLSGGTITGDLTVNGTIYVGTKNYVYHTGNLAGDNVWVTLSSDVISHKTIHANNITLIASSGQFVTGYAVDKAGHVTSISQRALNASDIPNIAITKVTGLQDVLAKKVDSAFFARVFGLLDADGNEIAVNDIATVADSIKAKFGLWTEQYISAKGKSSSTGGGGGASALYQLVDVAPNSTNDGVLNAANGSVLMYNGSKWQAGNVVTDISPLTLNVNGSSLFTYDGKSSITANLTVPTKVSQLTNDTGFITGISSSMVTSALGYTPYNSTNPNGYISGITKAMVEGVLTGNITSHTHHYLPLNGGKLSSDAVTNVLTLNSNVANAGTYLRLEYLGSKVAEFGHGWGLDTYMWCNGHNLRITSNGTAYADSNILIHSGNYNSFAPTLTGTGASGTWGISITGNAATATKSEYSRNLLGRSTLGNDYSPSNSDFIFAEWNTKSDGRWYLKGGSNECRVDYATLAGNADTVDGYHASSFLLRGRMTNPSSGTSYHGAIPFSISLKSAGFPVYTDPEFASGNNDIYVYNNLDTGAVTISRIADNQGSANSSGYILQISTTPGEASPGRGGFHQLIRSRQNAVFAQIFRAKIPVGFSVEYAENKMGNGSTTFWLTDKAGTGKWEWYIRITICGSGGTYQDGGHVYLEGSGAVTWYLAYCNVIDLTKGNYDGLRTVCADKLQTARTIWGQSFDGTGNISGNIIGVGSISPAADSSYNIGAASSQFKWVYANGIYAKTGSYLGLGANNADHIRIFTNGNVGIGTTTDNGDKLQVNGDINARAAFFGGKGVGVHIGATYTGSTSGAYDLIERGKSGSTLYMQYSHNGSISMCHGGGNVGIGTTSPSEKLHVIGNIAATGAVTAKASSSDIRLKTDISDYKALSIIRSHRSIKYHWNTVAKANADIFNDNDWHYGLIAQDVQRDMPQMVSDVFKDYLVINYERLIPICWKGLQEVDDEVTKLKKKVRKLEMEIRELKQKEDRL